MHTNQMESVWEHDTPHARFWRQLLQQNADQRRLDEEYLKWLRYQPERAKEDQKRFGHIWAEHNTNIYKLIAKSYGEVWDDEDEEKQRSRESASALEKTAACNQNGNDSLARSREESPRSRQHKLQGIPQASIGLMEESEKGQSCSGPGSGGSPPQETAATQEESRAGGGGTGGKGGTGPCNLPRQQSCRRE